MDPDLRMTLLKLSSPLLAIVVVLVVSRVRRVSLTHDLRLVPPAAKVAFVWLVGWAAWVALSEVIGVQLGFSEPPSWQTHSTPVIGLLCFGIVVLAPLAEESVFRGIIFWRVLRSPLGASGAILIGAMLFAALHFQYSIAQITLILVDGILLGLARYHSDSLLLPILMHALGNGFAAYQRLTIPA